MAANDPSMEGQDTPTDGQRRRTSVDTPVWQQQQQQKSTNVLVVDDLPEHTAVALCASETSNGPDLLNPDGGFCEMKIKTLCPLCKSGKSKEAARVLQQLDNGELWEWHGCWDLF